MYFSNSDTMPSFIYFCFFQNNIAAKSLFNIKNMLFFANNFTFNDNTGRILEGYNIQFILSGFIITNHLCQVNDYEGCICFVELDSYLVLSDIYVNSLTSNFIHDLFYLTNAQISISNIKLENIFTLSNTLLLYGKNTILTVQNCLFQNLNKSLIHLELNSNLSILHSTFIEIYYFLSIFECFSCKMIVLDNNSFESIYSSKGSCFFFISGY